MSITSVSSHGSAVRGALGRLRTAAAAYEKSFARVADAAPQALSSRSADLRALNALLYTSERQWRADQGLPHRDWFKHLAYAPGLYTGYGVKTLPGIRESVEQKEWDTAAKYVPLVAGAIDKLAAQVDKATVALGRVVQ